MAAQGVFTISLNDKAEYQRILEGKPQTFGMRSGRVYLDAGKACGQHSTKNQEELLVFLAGQGELLIGTDARHPVGAGKVAYIPPRDAPRRQQHRLGAAHLHLLRRSRRRIVSAAEIRNGDLVDLIVNFAPTGMIPTREMTPHVPVSVTEIVEEVHQAMEIGISMVHLHARDEVTGEPTYRAQVYERIIAGIRSFSEELIVCVSLSGRNFKEFAQRVEPLQLDGGLKPDMGSLTLSSLNFNNVASLNAPDMIMALAEEMQARGVLPELEAFDAGMINYARYLQRKGLLAPPFYFNLLLGNIACARRTCCMRGS